MDSKARLVFFVSFFAALTAAEAQPPAPKSLQLNIGCYVYEGSVIWQNPRMRDWYARRYSFLVGSGDNARSAVAQMRRVNPRLKALVYELFVYPASDTTKLKRWAARKGYDFESLILRVRNRSRSDSVTVRVSDISNSGFGRYVTTRPGGILLMPGYTDAQTRFCFDFRNPLVGEYLAETWKSTIEEVNYDGVLVDEEAIIGSSRNAPQGIYPLIAPFRDVTTGHWAYGSPYSSLTRSWGQNFDLEDANNYFDYTDVRDSLRRARRGWMRTAGRLMKGWGYICAPNLAAVPTNHLSNWYGEGIMMTSLAGSIILGEYSYFSPSANGQEDNCNMAVKACHSVRDSAVNVFLGWIRTGQFEKNAGISYERSKMTALGMFLDCYFPGKAKYHFSPSVKNGQVDFLMDRELDGQTADDTTTMWADAWGKYFGIPRATRDTSERGSDPSGQRYTLHRIKLGNPRNPSTVQTVVVGRYARGPNFSTSRTSIRTSLGGTFYQLQPSGRYTGPVTSASVANAEWHVFVMDTVLANRGSGEAAASTAEPEESRADRPEPDSPAEVRPSQPPSPVGCAPTPVSPSDITVASVWPTFQAGNIRCDRNTAHVYVFQIAVDESFQQTLVTSPPLPQGRQATSWRSSRRLIPGRSYYWRAKAINYEWSRPVAFHVSTSAR